MKYLRAQYTLPRGNAALVILAAQDRHVARQRISEISIANEAWEIIGVQLGSLVSVNSFTVTNSAHQDGN